MPRRRKDGPSANRTDTLASVQPIRTAPNQPYGEAGQQRAAQEAVPLPQDSTMQAVQAATAVDPTPLAAPGPSRFPDQPVTHGLAMGPGGGPESIPGLVAGRPTDPDLVAFAPYLPALELLANQPAASVAMRNFVRRVRGAMPPSASVPE